MILLALDTTSRFGSLALARHGEVVEVVAIDAPDGFGHVLFQQIQALLARHRLSLAEIDGYAAAAGPGSFTGVRIGLTAVKGLAEAHGKRVVPVSNLAALARAGSGELRAPLIDARRGEVYGAVYSAELDVVVPEMVGPLARFLEAIGGRPATFMTTDAAFLPATLTAVTVPRELAAPVALVAALVFAEGRALLPEQVDANYIRRSDAELSIPSRDRRER